MAETPTDKGKAYLEENGKKEGVKTTSSGLQYKVLKEGEGKTPKATDTVSVHYRGTLLDGTEFNDAASTNVRCSVSFVVVTELRPVGAPAGLKLLS